MKRIAACAVGLTLAMTAVADAAYDPSFQRGVLYAEQFGTAHNGVADDTAALQAALNQCAAQGGGSVELGPYVYIVNSAILSVPAFCGLEGNRYLAGGALVGNNYLTLPYTLLVNPAYTVQMRRNSHISGLNIVASNWTPATTTQAMASVVQAFAGTGLSLGPEGGSPSNNGNDITVHDLFIIGFNQCISQNWADRARGQNIFGDCANGLAINQSNDVSRWTNVHFWNYSSQNQANTISSAAISGVANSGSLIQITTATPHGFATGDTIVISGVGGVSAANGVWTVTVASATQFTLNGSSFSGLYTSGGLATLDVTLRTGVAFSVTNSAYVVIDDSFSYGYQTCESAGAGAVWATFENVGCDAALASGNPTSVGVSIGGNADRTHVIGGYVSSHGIPLVVNSSQTRQQDVTDLSLGATNGYALQALSGAANIVGGDITGGGLIYVANAATGVNLIGVNNNGSAISYQGPSAPTVNVIGATTSLGSLNALQNGAGAMYPLRAANLDTASGVQSACIAFGPSSSQTNASLCGGTSGGDFLNFSTGTNTSRLKLSFDGGNSSDLSPTSGQSVALGGASNAFAAGYISTLYFNSHLVAQGSAPTSLACGTGASFGASAHDGGGFITVGASPGTSCGFTFNTAYAGPAICSLNDMTSNVQFRQTSNSGVAVTFTVSSGTLTAADTLNYRCEGA